MYVKITNDAVDQFPYTVANLRRDNPNTSFPRNIPEETLNAWGVYRVQVSAMPSFDPITQVVVMDSAPVLSEGVWTVGYTVNSLTTEEVQSNKDQLAETNRERRNDLLAETDFHALSDVTMSSEMQSYRQSLRDITSHANWPVLEEADWPTKPS